MTSIKSVLGDIGGVTSGEGGGVAVGDGVFDDGGVTK